jgi:hypothetical protein
MSRRAARFTQAEAARLARVAASLGPAWRVVAIDGRLELIQGEDRRPAPKPVAPEKEWRL